MADHNSVNFLSENKIEIRRSRRRTLALEIRPEGTLLIRAPYRLPDREIRRFVLEKQGWIEKHLQKIEESGGDRPAEPFSEAELRELAKKAKEDLPERVAHFAKELGVTYGRITIRAQRTRWGSCSAAGNLNFNCLLMLLPEELRDYVVVHELCHRLEMNHSKRFWALVGNILPNYHILKKRLHEEGAPLMRRLG